LESPLHFSTQTLSVHQDGDDPVSEGQPVDAAKDKAIEAVRDIAAQSNGLDNRPPPVKLR
jgi:hypothetical protein